MIGMRTMLEVADNSGARKLQCILPRGGDLGLRAERVHQAIGTQFASPDYSSELTRRASAVVSFVVDVKVRKSHDIVQLREVVVGDRRIF